MTKDRQKDFETLGQAARRLLAGLERAEKKASRSHIKPGEIHNSTECPEVEKEAGEIGAYSSLLAGQFPPRCNKRRVGDDKAVLIGSNDNNAGWTSGEYDHRASPTLNPDDSAMPKTARIVTLRGSEW